MSFFLNTSYNKNVAVLTTDYLLVVNIGYIQKEYAWWLLKSIKDNTTLTTLINNGLLLKELIWNFRNPDFNWKVKVNY